MRDKTVRMPLAHDGRELRGGFLGKRREAEVRWLLADAERVVSLGERIRENAAGLGLAVAPVAPVRLLPIRAHEGMIRSV
ncbi:MAG: hypothetical protein HY704_13550 [Gemmatimonadetes bacterium]|nr:hypothetical protein [Gemmatimonadota bacterium]